MYKLKILPDTTGFTITAGQSTISTMLAGGAPRVRLDQLGAVFTVTCQWSVGPADFNYLQTFFRTGTVYGSLPFQIDLLGAEGSVLTTYTAIFVPGSWKLLSQIGLTYVQGATLWAIPTINGGAATCAQKALLTQYAVASGQKLAWSFAGAVAFSSFDTGGHATGDTCSAAIVQTGSRPLGQTTHGAQWSSFPMPTLPSGAIIIGMYPVMIAAELSPTGATESTVVTGWAGYSITYGDTGTSSLFGSADLNTNAGTMTTYTGASLGTTASALTNLDLVAWVQNTLSMDNMTEFLKVDFVGVAVVYV